MKIGVFFSLLVHVCAAKIHVLCKFRINMYSGFMLELATDKLGNPKLIFPTKKQNQIFSITIFALCYNRPICGKIKRVVFIYINKYSLGYINSP